jgi:transposase
VTLPPDDLPSDLASALAALRSEREARLQAEAAAASARAKLSDTEALIAHLQLMIEKLKREKYGQRSERTARLIEQMELQLEDLVTAANEDELAAAAAATKSGDVRAFTRKRPVRRPWPEEIERERVVIDPPTACTCCGGSRLSKLGEDVTETLEEIPRRFKLIETVREKFSCRDCGKVSQPPAPFHATPRGFIGPQLLATIVFDKFGQHIPLNRQSTRFKAEGIDLPLSTLADQVGHGTFALKPVFDLIETHVLAAGRLHGDDTTVPILAKCKCATGRIWTYVRDDGPFAGPAPPAALYYASSDRRGEHPQKHLAGFAGILQCDCYGGFDGIKIIDQEQEHVAVGRVERRRVLGDVNARIVDAGRPIEHAGHFPAGVAGAVAGDFLHRLHKFMVVNAPVVGAGHGAQLDAAVAGFEGFDLLARVRAQPVLQVDARERSGKLTQIGGGRADLAGHLAEAPMRRCDRRVRSGQDQGQSLRIGAARLDMDKARFDHAGAAALRPTAHRIRQLRQGKIALVGWAREPL